MTCSGFGDQCTECLSDGCADRWCNCKNNPDCIGLIQCANNCNNNPMCEQGCLSTHEPGISDLYLLTDCAATACDAECPGNDQIDPCTVCLLEDCTDEANACLAEPECLALYQCLGECPNLDLMCQQGCYNDHGAGVMTLQPLLMCAQSTCPGPCT